MTSTGQIEPTLMQKLAWQPEKCYEMQDGKRLRNRDVSTCSSIHVWIHVQRVCARMFVEYICLLRET